jgi:hypothetical protein
MDQLKHLIEVWTSYAQGLTGSIGALAFVCAFIWMIARLDEFFTSLNGQSVRNTAVAARGCFVNSGSPVRIRPSAPNSFPIRC